MAKLPHAFGVSSMRMSLSNYRLAAYRSSLLAALDIAFQSPNGSRMKLLFTIPRIMIMINVDIDEFGEDTTYIIMRMMHRRARNLFRLIVFPEIKVAYLNHAGFPKPTATIINKGAAQWHRHFGD